MAGGSTCQSLSTVSSRDTGKGSKDNKTNVSESSSSTMAHVVKTGDAMLLITTDLMECVIM
jgi:hypothetical protein